MKKDIMLKVGIVVFILFFSTAYAVTLRYVHPDSALNSIQVALDTCGSGDVVLVAPGTYYENIVWPNRQGLRLMSARGASTTILDGDTSGSVMVITTGVDSTTVISGFTIRNGKASSGGGIYCENSTPLIMNNIINNNKADGVNGGGGGIYLYNSPALITNNTITLNDADAVGGGIYCKNSSGTIKNNTLYDNDATFGGGIFCEDCSPIISDNIITKSLVDSAGAGIGADINASPSISNNIIFDNRQWAGSEWCGGGGIGTGQGCWPFITDNFIVKNFAGFGGGGIACHDATITSNIITANYSGYGGGIVCAANSSPTITGNTITKNSVVEVGGGIILDNNCSASITGNIIDENVADYGGGIGVSNSATPTITSNFVRWNTASSGGAGIMVYLSASPTIDSCVIIANNGDGVSGGILANADIHYCDIIANTGYGVLKSGFGGTFDATYNYWGDPSGPSGSGPGTGDEVSDNVAYDPWLGVSVRDSAIPASPYVASRKSGNDLTLTWNPITTDTLGNPETVNYYVIYRDTVPSFVPGIGDSIGAVAHPDTEYTDTGVLTAAQSYYYLVKSVDYTFNKSKKSNMGYKFNKFLNENPDTPTPTSDRNWVSLPFNSEYDSVRDLTNDLCSLGVPITTIYKLDPPTQYYYGWYWLSGDFWYGDEPPYPGNFAIVPGAMYEMISPIQDSTVVIVGSNDPDGLIQLNENPDTPTPTSDRNWVSIPYNAVYQTVSDITSEYSDSGWPIQTIYKLDEATQFYYGWYWLSGDFWYGDEPPYPGDFAIIPGTGYEFINGYGDTTWNPTEYTNEAVAQMLARRQRHHADVEMLCIGEALASDRAPVWMVEPVQEAAKKRIDYSAARTYTPVIERREHEVERKGQSVPHVVRAIDVGLDGFEDPVFTVYRPDNPYDVLTEKSAGSLVLRYESQYLVQFNVGNFQQSWQDGEEVILIIEAIKQGRGYCAVVNFELVAGLNMQELTNITLVPIPHPEVRNGLLSWNRIDNENIVGYSVYKNNRRLNERVLEQSEYRVEDDVHVKPVMRGGYETVYRSQNVQDMGNDELPISYAFDISPNPFAKRTNINYALPHASQVDIVIYDITGRKVKSLVSGRYEPGYYQTQWLGDDERGRSVATGSYFIQMNAQEFESQRKIIFVH